VIALPLVIGAVWWPALGASFQFDDWNVIVNDARVQSLGAWATSLPGIRPVLKFSYALNHTLGGTVSGFRALNLLIHACSAMLVAVLFRGRALAAGATPATAAFAGMLVAACFALHPVQTEAVTYLSGRSASLAALFVLCALYAWLRGRAASADRARARVWSGAALGAFVLALGSKETALVLPLLLWLWGATETSGARVRWRELRGFVAGSLAMCVLALFWAPYRSLLLASLAVRPLWLNALTQARAGIYLAQQLFWPMRLNADPQLPAVDHADLHSVLWLLCWLLLALGALFFRRRWPQACFGVLWFIACLLPTNSLLPRLDVANDRQLYLALLGPAWLLTLAVVRLTDARHWLRWLSLLLVSVLLGAATVHRNEVYANEIVFWQDVTAQSPRNARAANNLGMALAIACRDAEAGREFRRSIALQPGDYRARINLRLLESGDLLAPAARHCPPN